MKILVTGGAGFIGSNFVRYILNKYPSYKVIVLDKLTYAGRLDNLSDLKDDKRLTFVKGDICDSVVVKSIMPKIDVVVNFAAETHVDRSIIDAGSFVTTDVHGTYTLLEAARKQNCVLFLQVSTDEVYGEVVNGSSSEHHSLFPRNPYSASKAGAEFLARSYWNTYQLPVIITRGSNTFGPYQYPEKLIPVLVANAISDQPLPIYGDGKNVRDWLHVLDHCAGIDCAMHKGKTGEVYNIGGGNERTNLEIAEMVLNILEKPRSLIQFVADRPGHDRRYSLDCSKLKALGWEPKNDFNELFKSTVMWYANNPAWWRQVIQRSHLLI